ncbi:MAG: preprotein translocase subunit SecE [bacterium]
MPLSIYKPGQGYYTRMLSAIGAATLVLVGIAWLWRELEVLANPFYYQVAAAIVIIAGTGALMWWLLNKPRVADFMIATEAEMKKVNWPTRREIIGSTWVVICGVLMLAALLFIIDIAFGWLFTEINILNTGSGS